MIWRTFLILLCLAVSTGAQTESEGAVTFESPPERVVVLDWALAEQVLDLDIVPVGAPELELYSEWVSAPKIPEGVADVGLRTEPNLERIAELAPDVILASDIDAAQERKLSRIAPTLVFDAWSAEHDNVAAARDIYLRLADLFGRAEMAKARLDEMEARLDKIAVRISELDLPGTATVIRLNDDSTVWIYGANSIPVHTLDRIGLAPELDLPAARWGVTQRPLDDLAAAREGALLAIGPHMGGAEAMSGPLWSALPAIRERRFAEVPRVWSYGGILSVERHAEAFLDALEGLD